jgi:hypothetical protein
MFLKAGTQGTYNNYALVKMVHRRGNRATLEFTDGTVHQIEHQNFDLLKPITGMIFPGFPGFQLVSRYKTADENGIVGNEIVTFKEPIVAFRHYGHDLAPITLSGEVEESSWAVLDPSGKVHIPWDRSFDSLEEWEADVDKTIKENEKRKEKASS